MEGGRGFGGGSHDMMPLLDDPNNSFWLPPPSSYPFQDTMTTMVNFNQVPQEDMMAINSKRDRTRRWTSILEDIGEDDSDGNLNLEKKRRLTKQQAQFLEMSFELDMKLDPERKVQLAKEAGLQPRQVSIWFQNRRARCKTKLIEKEFETLKASYERLKIDYDSLNCEKENLKNEVEVLTKKLEGKEGNQMNSNPNNMVQFDKGVPYMQTYGKVGIAGSGLVGMQTSKQTEDASSAKSDILDSESPYCTDGNQGSVLLEACSAPMRGLDQQLDFLHDEHLMMNKNLLLPETPPTFNSFVDNLDDPNSNFCNFTSLVDDQPWSWLL